MMIITLVWKISIHVSGITAAATFLVYHLGAGMLPFFMLLFPVGWARIRLKAHSLAQVVGGALLTMVLVILQLIIFK
jgi:membrane-associated phospholipid phosphatase